MMPEWKPRHQMEYTDFRDMCVQSCGGPNIPNVDNMCGYDSRELYIMHVLDYM